MMGPTSSLTSTVMSCGFADVEWIASRATRWANSAILAGISARKGFMPAWSREDEELLLRLISKTDLTQREIAQKIGRTEAAVALLHDYQPGNITGQCIEDSN